MLRDKGAKIGGIPNLNTHVPKNPRHKVLGHGHKNGPNQSCLRKERAKLAGCLHDKDHIQFIMKKSFYVVLYVYGIKTSISA